MLRAALGGTCIIAASLTSFYLMSCYDFGYTAPRTDDGGLPDVFTLPSDAPEDVHDAGPAVDACASNRGPEMIAVHPPRGLPQFCIDATEVTRAQYAEFLNTNPSATPGNQIAQCGWNKSFKPTQRWPDGGVETADYPINFIDWCDAYAFCKWAGKRLCGDVNGGPHGFKNVGEDPSRDTDQWRIACTADDDPQHIYPYGATFEPKYCNWKDAGVDHPLATKAEKNCVGGFPGIYDMSGNVNELEDSCDDAGGPDAAGDSCWCRGGSYLYTAEGVKCASDKEIHTVPREYVADDLGFRCCR